MRIKWIFESNLESENLTQLHRTVEFVDAQERTFTKYQIKIIRKEYKKTMDYSNVQLIVNFNFFFLFFPFLIVENI